MKSKSNLFRRLSHDPHGVLAGVQLFAFVRVELRSQFGFRIIFQWFVRLELSVTVFADSQHRYSSASRLRF